MKVATGWSLQGLPAPILDNGQVQVVVLPTLGGKIWQIRDLVTRREFLWANERAPLRQVPFGASYDDSFHGGWDVLFPNDIPETIGGESYPDHGEVWSLPWQWQASSTAEEVAVEMSIATPISQCRLTRRVALRAGERRVRVRESVANEGHEPLPYLWKQHLALCIDEPASIGLPDCEVIIGDFGQPRAGSPGQAFRWPMLEHGGAWHDMRATLGRESRRCELLYGTNLPQGWCSLSFPDGTGIGLAFDAAVFPSCWTFASYGGWRGLQVAILEPCSGYSLWVVDGVEAGTHQVLPPLSTTSTELVATLFDGITAVTGIDREGHVEGERG